MNLDEFIDNALQEDIGTGDITTLAVCSDKKLGKAKLLIKDTGILAGVPVAQKVFNKVDSSLEIEVFKNDGDTVVPGDIVFEVSGNMASILVSERLVLNFMQRLSGIATMTHQAVKLIKGTKSKILDTRKTTPNMRDLEKYAVRVGGGTNHRMGLYDMVMIKDNHVDMAGGIMEALRSVSEYRDKMGIPDIKTEIEVRNFEELMEVIEYGKADRIMLDNFTPEDLADAVKLIDRRFETEASGGITIANIHEYAETGVDFISMGALTHNFRSLDMSLKILLKGKLL